MNCRNSDEFLEEAIESVFAQTFEDWEIVFWDNQSTDRSPAIAKRFEGKLRYFRGETPLSLGAARNAAIDQARGEYLAILDCDDVWLPTKLARQVETLDRDPRLGIVFSDALIIDATGTVTGTFFDVKARPRTGDPRVELLTGPNFIPCPTAMMRTSVVREAGGFDAALHYAEEYDLFIRMLSRSGLAWTEEAFSKYRVHGGNQGGWGKAEMTREVIEVIGRSAAERSRLSQRDIARVRKRLGLLHAKLFVQCLRNGEPAAALRAGWDSFATLSRVRPTPG